MPHLWRLMQPLRLVLPREANETMAQVIPLVRSVVGWDLEPTYVGVTEVGPTVLSQTTTLGKAYFDTCVHESRTPRKCQKGSLWHTGSARLIVCSFPHAAQVGRGQQLHARVRPGRAPGAARLVRAQRPQAGLVRGGNEARVPSHSPVPSHCCLHTSADFNAAPCRLLRSMCAGPTSWGEPAMWRPAGCSETAARLSVLLVVVHGTRERAPFLLPRVPGCCGLARPCSTARSSGCLSRASFRRSCSGVTCWPALGCSPPTRGGSCCRWPGCSTAPT